MKRTEAVKILADHLQDLLSDYVDREELEGECGYVLGLLEKAGMMPPLTQKYIKNVFGEQKELPHTYVNEWEKE